MNAIVTKINSQPSKFGGIVYLITFSCEDGKSRRSWIDPKNGNYKNWIEIINQGKGTNLSGLSVKDNFLINADSKPIIIK